MAFYECYHVLVGKYVCWQKLHCLLAKTFPFAQATSVVRPQVLLVSVQTWSRLALRLNLNLSRTRRIVGGNPCSSILFNMLPLLRSCVSALLFVFVLFVFASSCFLPAKFVSVLCVTLLRWSSLYLSWLWYDKFA